VQAILETSNHELWLGSSDGVDIFNKETGIFTNFKNDTANAKSINYNGANVIYEDTKNNIWLGTDGGLNLFIRKDSSFIYYREENGLPNNSIKAICEDRHGNLWLSTNNGISKFINGVNNPNNPEFKNYNKSDGLQDNEFNRRSSFKDKKGIIYFGGIKGFNFFNPDDLKENLYIPEVFITEFLHFNKPVEIDAENSMLKQNINITNELVLKHDVSVISFRYAALNYIAPDKNQYAYFLEGFEKDWNYVGNKREVTYTNLNPGTYTFRVKASNNDGHWNQRGVSLKITILPPWWATLWFRLLVIIVIIGTVFYYIYTRTKKLTYQKKVLEERVKERTSELSEVTVLLEEKQQEILTQNEELRDHREKLEQMVNERTSDLEKALKKAEESDRLKTAFLANMSHEIRTPMNSIVGFSSLLDEDDYSKAEKKEFTTIIHKNCESLQVLINDIIEVSLIESDQMTLVKSNFEVIAILKELESFYRMKNAKGLEINFILNDFFQEFWLNSDPVRFRQIISNLIDNAVKYTEKGYVHFGFKVSGNFVEFFVSDSGIGIPKEEYDNVFNHFYKIETDTTKLYRGAGIGLSICKKLVGLLGGVIWIDSEVSKGTAFYFTLPNEKSSMNREEIPGIKKESLISLNSKSVLIVEDEENNSILLRKILEVHGAKVKWVKNGREAVDLVLNNNKFDLILMDIKMPVMDGVEATKLIRARYHDLPIIAVTAYSLASEKARYMKAGFTDYISKPLDTGNFIASIKNWLK
jgi:signal transduction histidine kinase